MNNLEEIKLIIAAHMDILKSQYKVKEIGVFGSYVRGKVSFIYFIKKPRKNKVFGTLPQKKTEVFNEADHLN